MVVVVVVKSFFFQFSSTKDGKVALIALTSSIHISNIYFNKFLTINASTTTFLGGLNVFIAENLKLFPLLVEQLLFYSSPIVQCTQTNCYTR